jgi:hypothetical protein
MTVKPWFSFGGERIKFSEPEPRITSVRMGDFAAHFPETKPEVTMLFPNGVDGLCKLFADGRPVLTGTLREACAALKKLGLQPGDTYTLCRPDIGIEQVIRYRTAAERTAGVPVTVSTKPIQQEG